jgi:uncharacterized membrane protein YidH (DUF202 family)
MLLLCPWLVLALPGLVPFAVGLVSILLTLRGPFRVGSVTFDVHTMSVGGMLMILGAQALMMARLARRKARRELLGSDPRPAFLTLERAIVAGMTLVIAGLAPVAALFVEWWRSSFGPLNPEQTLRPVLTGSVIAIIGAQVVLFAFFNAIVESGDIDDRGAESP